MLKKLRLYPSDIFNNDFQGQELKHTVVRGSLALAVSQGTTLGLSLISTIVLARLLTPTDFGIVGMVTVFINFLFIFKDIGLSHATIQKDEITSPQISTLFWINGLISLFLGVIILASSPLVAKFYQRPELVAVTAALSITFVVEGFTIQHNSLLRRHFKFTALAMIDIIARLTHLIVAIVMATMGYNYWALVGGLIARSIILLLLTFFSCPWIPGRMQRGAGVRNMLKFGGHITGAHILGYLSRNLDGILIGRFIGAAPLGLYNKAQHTLMQPITQIRTPVTSLSLPVLSSLKNDPDRFQNYFKRLLDIISSLAMPISVYCFLESEFLIRLILGPNWMEAVPVFRILAIGGIFLSTSFVPGIVMISCGFSKRYMQLSLVTSGITAASFVVGLPFGINGIAVAYTIANFLILIPLVIYGFRGTPIRLRLVAETMAGPVASTVVAGLVSYIFIRFYSMENGGKHLLTGLVFFVIYTGLTLLRAHTRETIRSIWNSIVNKT